MENRKTVITSDFLSGTSAVDAGSWCAVVDVLASNDVERLPRAFDECLAGLNGLGAVLNVFADYKNLKAENPRMALYANDGDMALALSTVSDLIQLGTSALGKIEVVREALNQGSTVPTHGVEG